MMTKLTRTDLCCLRVADGIATSADYKRLENLGIHVQSWQQLSWVLKTALTDVNGTIPDVATNVLDQIDPISNVELSTGQNQGSDEYSFTDLTATQIHELEHWELEHLKGNISLKELLTDPSPVALEDTIMACLLDERSDNILHSDATVDTQDEKDEKDAPNNIVSIPNLLASTNHPEMIDSNSGTLGDIASFLRDPNPPDLSDLIMENILTQAKDIQNADNEEEVFLLENPEEMMDLSPIKDIETKSEKVDLVDDRSWENDLNEVLEELMAENLEEIFNNSDPLQDFENALKLKRQKLEEAPEKDVVELHVDHQTDMDGHDVWMNRGLSLKNQDDLDEDSNEDFCTIEDIGIMEDPILVTEDLLSNQVNFSEVLKSALLDQEVHLNIWDSISHRVNTFPPLRLLEDDNIEVVEKIPTQDVHRNFDDSENQDDSNVEFIQSTIIDADSTISRISMGVFGGFLALVASWLVLVLPEQLLFQTEYQNRQRPEAFEVAQVNILEVEELEVAENMSVHFFQSDDDAPTIIFIEDLSGE